MKVWTVYEMVSVVPGIGMPLPTHASFRQPGAKYTGVGSTGAWHPPSFILGAMLGVILSGVRSLSGPLRLVGALKVSVAGGFGCLLGIPALCARSRSLWQVSAGASLVSSFRAAGSLASLRP